MNRLLRILPVIFVLTSISAFADSINISNLAVNFGVASNYGSGDNIGGQLYNSYVNLYVGGGTPGNWFSNLPYAPGSTGGGPTAIYYDSVFGNIGSLTLNGNSTIFASSLGTGYFTFPTNGEESFTVTLPASLGPISGYVCGDTTCTPYFLQTLPGTLTLSFYYYDGYYYADSGTFIATAPEPGTLGLMGIGLSAFIWCWHKQKLMSQRTV